MSIHRPQPVGSKSPKRWRRICCLPYIVLYVLFLAAFVVGVVLSILFAHSENSDIPEVDLTTTAELIIFGFLITISVFVGIIAVANLYTLGNVVQSLLYSPRRHLQRTVAKLEVVKSEGYLQVCNVQDPSRGVREIRRQDCELQAVKGEVHLLLEMVRRLDSLTGQQSRLVVVVDGLDSCEQSKVLSVLDAVHMLFSDPGSPFILLLAIDPHVITKAIELNLNRALESDR